MTYLLLLPVLLVVLFALGVRLAPSDPARWHGDVPLAPARFEGGRIEVIAGDADTFRHLAEIAQATPRTQILAGSATTGHLTLITRSKLWGFPDYTTMQLTEGQIALYARLRFGSSDTGVNSARLDDWLQRLEAVDQGR
ncbi:DUF1499 domain-containing protein [Aliiroseovarius subalbicans]|uniref:DUF1499 domain-containing protein n=1 Tax=Aliiroseovarius subalbicans TaxID=2925840 RepID=UPI001F56A986|nr:DUF1499 domain-containing protein [Aliiroseovarius subalbicans]MCI2398479.1 DUF1499 domain-containing protein [Aliiroseovarius subalbicans]